MWLDTGIDSGNLVATERTELTGSETLTGLHIAVMDHAHALYVKCARRFLEGRQLPSVPQAWISEGRLFLNRDWTARQVLKAVNNFYLHYRREAKQRREPLVLIDPTQGAADAT